MMSSRPVLLFVCWCVAPTTTAAHCCNCCYTPSETCRACDRSRGRCSHAPSPHDRRATSPTRHVTDAPQPRGVVEFGVWSLFREHAVLTSHYIICTQFMGCVQCMFERCAYSTLYVCVRACVLVCLHPPLSLLGSVSRIASLL